MKKKLIAIFLSLGLHIAFISILYLVSIKQENKEVNTISLLHVSLKTYQKEVTKIDKVKKKETINPQEIQILKDEKQKVIPKIKPFVQQEEKNLASLAQNDDTNTSHHLAKEIISMPIESKVNYQDDFIKENLTLITKAIEKNKSYPLLARKKHIEGIVEIEFTLSKECKITEIKAIKGSILLQEAAITTIEKAQSEFPCPSQTISLYIPMSYTLK